MDRLEALSPLDGRYRDHLEKLAEIFCEKGLMQYRILVEAEYLIALSEHPETDLRNFGEEEKRRLIHQQHLTIIDARIIKMIEIAGHGDRKATHHDVKAIEYFLKDHLGTTSLRDVTEWIHFALTSEDITNIAYALKLRDALEKIIIPLLNRIYHIIEGKAREYKSVAMLARTHEQPASPTTLGKEFKVFAERLKRQLNKLKHFEVLTKLNSATGNYNAHYAAYPNIDWIQFSQDFIESFNKNHTIRLMPNLFTTQIEPHDTYAELFDIMRRINIILYSFQQNIRRYIGDEWLVQKSTTGEIHSSTMPHKINPKELENAKGNLKIANALFNCFSTELPVSELQRELSDSTIERNFGTALGYCVISYQNILQGLEKVTPDEIEMKHALEKHPEIISEAIQTILRREGLETPYEKLHAMMQKKKMTREDINQFIDNLKITENLKVELHAINAANFTGLAAKLADMD